MTKSAAELTSHKASFDGGVQTAWDATSLTAAHTCSRYYYYSLIRGIQPKTTSVHLLFGAIYASALELFYKTRAKGHSIDEATIEMVRHAMLESWDEENGVPMFFDSTEKTRFTLLRSLVWYVEEFADESDAQIKTHHLENGDAAVEVSFSINVDNDILLCGHLDRVVDYGDILYVMDQKTTKSALSNYYFSGFDLDNQMSLYPWAGQMLFGTPVSGVIIDAAQITPNFTNFARGFTTRSKPQLDEWYEETMGTIERMQKQTYENFFPRNLTACGNYGGCKFKHLCSVAPRAREAYIKSDYAPHNWDPIIRR